MDRRLADRTVDSLYRAFLSEGVGNYTKSYETWKRVQNVCASFTGELKTCGGPEVTVLDLGCGDGYHLFLLNRLIDGGPHQVKFLGVDLSEIKIEVARRVGARCGFENIEFQAVDLRSIELPAKQYDIVLCTDVIEHIADTDTFLDMVHDRISPGGLAVVTTPNSENMAVAALRELTRREKRKEAAEPYFEQGHGHVSLKKVSEWVRSFQERGFVVEKIRRGSILFGGPRYNRHRFLFSLVLLLDTLLDRLPFMRAFSEAHTFSLRKPQAGLQNMADRSRTKTSVPS